MEAGSLQVARFVRASRGRRPSSEEEQRRNSRARNGDHASKKNKRNRVKSGKEGARQATSRPLHFPYYGAHVHSRASVLASDAEFRRFGRSAGDVRPRRARAPLRDAMLEIRTFSQRRSPPRRELRAAGGKAVAFVFNTHCIGE